jgi:hypothetical protein
MLLAGAGALLLAPLLAWLSPLMTIRGLPAPQEPVITESVTEEIAT